MSIRRKQEQEYCFTYCRRITFLLSRHTYSVAFGVILSLLFVFFLFVRMRISQRRMVRSAWNFGSGYRANTRDGNEVVWGLAAPGGRKKRQIKFSLLWESMGNFCNLAVFERCLSNACTDPHQILYVYGQCLPTCHLPLWDPSAPGGRGEGELKTQKIGGGLIRA